MAAHSHNAEAISRGARMLRTALGPQIACWLDDENVVEIMLNPDGRLWLDRLTSGLEDAGATLPSDDGERIIRLVAHHVGAEVNPEAPRVSAELPTTGERFEGLLPPVVAAPAFAIRKPAVAVFTLEDYVAAGVMAQEYAATLRAAVVSRMNVLVAGGTSTGKTTLVNALLAEVAKTSDRVVLIEDTRELQCAASNLVALRTKDGAASLSDLVRSSFVALGVAIGAVAILAFQASSSCEIEAHATTAVTTPACMSFPIAPNDEALSRGGGVIVEKARADSCRDMSAPECRATAAPGNLVERADSTLDAFSLRLEAPEFITPPDAQIPKDE